jgi:hypothetical protein
MPPDPDTVSSESAENLVMDAESSAFLGYKTGRH